MLNSKTLLAAALGAALLMPSAARAQQAAAPAAKPNMELTALDYFQIQQLVSRYAQAIDTCSNSGYDYADLFTADGFFAPFSNGQIGRKAQGREALAVASGGGAKGCTGAGWIKQGVHHIYVNHIIDPDARGSQRHGQHADDRAGRRSQQDRARRVLRGHLREDAAGLALQVARPPHDLGAAVPEVAAGFSPRRRGLKAALLRRPGVPGRAVTNVRVLNRQPAAVFA